MTGSEALEVTRLIMWQTPDEVATDLEIMDHLFRLDELFDAGVFDAEEMVELKAILACQSARNFDHLSALNFDQVSGGYCGA
ncbi:hypothetical protein [Azovibrio restrictus]|uniref:hypothetical protein n=1 Tax=Azovibrio restrictus TaxID=146938 RepID=UPI0026ED0A6A|nr:hypothetical protein [Azovibrio restrictus]